MPCAGDPAGVINLPYAEIEEPFEAWYNLTGNKSRIQYYEGKHPSAPGCARPAPAPSPCKGRTWAGPPCLSFPFLLAQGR